jgi:urease accessory protein
VQRVLYLDEALPDMAFVYLCNPTAGVLQGDALQVRVRAAPGARAHLTTQAATKVFAMPSGSARLDTCLYVDQGAWLEYLPEPLIPFQGANFAQNTSAVVAAGATLILGEVLAPGRAAMGEALAYTRLASSLDISDTAGQPIYREACCITPATRSPLGPGILPRRHPALGSLVVVTDDVPPGELLRRIRPLLEAGPGAAAGASGLHGGRGVGVRVLGEDTAAVRGVLHRAWAEVRRCLLGVDAPPPRRY